MDKPVKPVEGVLAKVPADRRSFVQSILGLAGYSVPAVRSFIPFSPGSDSQPQLLSGTYRASTNWH